jgi:PLP dependent protein
VSAPPEIHRREDLLAALAQLRTRIVDVARRVGRDPHSITLIAVTKTYPASDVRALLELGVLDIGESRDQEARHKAAEVVGPRWHFIGRVQTNKARSIASYAHAVHSIDRPESAVALAEAVQRSGRGPLSVFAQLSVDADPRRGGVVISALPALADLIAAQPGLELAGVMAVAPMGLAAGAAFDVVARASDQLRRDHPDADAISAGMSNDFEAAITAGSTHLRVGTALLGRRTPDFG